MKLQIRSGANKLNQYILNEDWYAVKSRCEKHPNEAGVWTKRVGFFDGEHDSRVLPLHQACALHAPKDVIHDLIKAYPKGVQETETGFKRLPLHVACQHGSSADVVQLLLSYNPLGGRIEDIFGRTPMHYACSNGAPPEVMDAFLSVDASTASYPDTAGWLPIHVACHMGVSTEAIQKLLDANPRSANAKTKKGSTPLKLLSKINCKNKDEIAGLLVNASVAREQVTSICTSNTGAKEGRFVSSAA